MGNFAATDVTITISSRNRDLSLGGFGPRAAIATVAFGDGVLTYAAGGVPLPAIGSFGFKRELSFVGIQQPSANGLFYKYDATNHKLKIFTQGIVTGSVGATVNPAATATPKIETSASAAGTVFAVGATIDTTYDMGQLIELPAGFTPAAASVTLLLVGE